MKIFLWKIYVSRFLDSFILIGIIFALFFSKQGLNPFQISQLISIWSVTTILTEVPFGVLADNYSRKNLLVAGLVIRAIGFGFWIIGGYNNFAIGFILWGIKNTLTSGTLEALVYDELVYYKKEHLYEEVTGKMNSAFSAGLMLSGIFGGLIAQISFNYVLIASLITTLIAALLLYTLRSVKMTRSTGEVNYYSTLTKALSQVKQNKVLLYIIAFICLVFASFGAADEYWSLIFESLRLPVSTIGLLVSLIYGLGIIVGLTIKYFKNISAKIDCLMIITGGFLYLIFGISKYSFFIPLVFLAIYLIQTASIKLEAELQRNINPQQRATISSIKSLIFELVYMGYVLVFGYLGNRFGVVTIAVFTGLIIVISASFFYIIKPKILPPPNKTIIT